MAGKPTVRELRASYTPEKAASDRGFSLWVAYAARPMSFPLTWLFVRAGMSANQVTWLGTVMALAGCALLALGGYAAQVAGAALVVLWSVLDTVDGNLARYYRSAGRRGEFMDALSGYLIVVALFTAVGIGAFLHPDRGIEWAEALGLDRQPVREAVLFLGAWAALIAQTSVMVSGRYRTLFGDSYQRLLPSKNARGRAVALAVFLKSLAGYGAMAPAVLVGAVAGLGSLVVVYYAAFGTAGLLLVATTTALRAPRG